jgi:hypothetical protein
LIALISNWQGIVTLVDLITRPGSALDVSVTGPGAANNGGGEKSGRWQRTIGLGTADIGYASAARALFVLAPDDAWAALDYERHDDPSEPHFDFNDYRALVHWDGRSWTSTPYPRPDGQYLSLVGLYASDERRVWAVGSAGDIPLRPVILAWDGNHWVHQGLPGPADAQLLGISGSGYNDVWAVGGQAYQAYDGGSGSGLGSGLGSGTGSGVAPANGPLALHWDGKEWSQVAFPASAGGVTLAAVRAFGIDGAWAVGFDGPAFAWYSESRTPVAFHWDGVRWSESAMPDPGPIACPGSSRTHLAALDGASSSDVWAVGYCTDTDYPYEFDTVFPSRGLAYHWDGQAWTVSSVSNAYKSQTLHGVAVAPDGQVWAVGQVEELTRSNFNELYVAGSRPLVLLWSAGAWREMPSIQPYPKVDTFLGTQGFQAVDVAPDGTVWAAGHAGDSVFLGYEALLEVFTPKPHTAPQAP